MKPNVEELEPRAVPAAVNRIVLDLSPDAGYFGTPAPFRADFQTGRYTDSLDANHDGIVNMTDAAIMAKRIRAGVAADYVPLGFKVTVGDMTGREHWGTNWLAEAKKRGDDLYVIVLYVGGESPVFGDGVAGLAPQADIGFNVEGWGEIYTHAVFSAFDGWMPWKMVEAARVTCIHEAGHMLGLGHTVQDLPRDPMNAYLSDQPWLQHFRPQKRDAYLYNGTEDAVIQPQNPLVEINASLTQPAIDIYGNSTLGILRMRK